MIAVLKKAGVSNSRLSVLENILIMQKKYKARFL